MIEVNNHLINEDELVILNELKRQLELNGIKRFHKTIPTKDNIMTCCPFHNEGQEKKPSFGILTKSKGNDKSGTCHCFACGWTGSFAEMVSNCFGYDDMGLYGGKWLIKNFLTFSIENRPDIDFDFSRKPNKETKQFVSEDELDNYRYYHEYMWQRKLTPEIVDLFDVGYDNRTQCITFPIRDIDGNCLFVARRNVKTKFFNYPENVEKPVYGLYELMSMKTSKFKELFPKEFTCDECIICESMIDALTCWVYGKPAVALNGLGNDLQFKQLRAMPFRKFILATDMDEAGLRARKRIKQSLNNKIVTEYYWDINVAKDINDMTEDYFKNCLTEIF